MKSLGFGASCAEGVIRPELWGRRGLPGMTDLGAKAPGSELQRSARREGSLHL